MANLFLDNKNLDNFYNKYIPKMKKRENIYTCILTTHRSGNHLLTDYLKLLDVYFNIDYRYINKKNSYIIIEYFKIFSIFLYGYNSKDRFYILERKNKIYQAISKIFADSTLRYSNFDLLANNKVIFNLKEILKAINCILLSYLNYYLIFKDINFKIITYENLNPIFIKSLLEENKDIIPYDNNIEIITNEKILRNSTSDLFYDLTINELNKLNTDYKLFEEYFLVQDNIELTISNLKKGIEMTNIYKSLEDKNYLGDKEFELYK
jgi:hypothetical protein